MSDETKNERAYARMARASWGYASRGARRHAESARAWVRAEGIEAHIRENDARAVSARAQREARAHARKGRRARTAPSSAPPSALTPHEVKARALGTRTMRALVTLAVPVGLALYPPYALLHGDPLALLTWPVTYGYLAWNGWTFSREQAGAAEHTEPAAEPKTKLFSKPRVKAKADTGLNPTSEESAIIERINAWEDYAAERRLHEVFPGPPVIDESGLLIPITFAGQWTPSKLDAQIDQLRALLAVPDEVRTQIRPGGTADRAVLRVRTRIRELDLRWTPERAGLGLDADTAEVVFINTTERLLVAGTSGAGKSVALRVLMADALAKPDTSLVILDLKKAEGALWRHTARVEVEPEGIQEVIDELIAEMKEREDIMETRGMDLWEATGSKPNIVVAVDEGAELMAEVPDSVGGLRSLARRARAAGIRLWWATQKPTMSGNGPGLDSQIAGQLTTQVCLAVAGAKEARVVLGEDATGKGWHAEDLLKGGWALVHGDNRDPDPMRVWFMTKEDVKALPARKPWRRMKFSAEVDASNILSVSLRLSEGLNGVSTAKLAQTLGISDTEVHARLRSFGVSPEPNAFALGNGEKARGYRKSALQEAQMMRMP